MIIGSVDKTAETQEIVIIDITISQSYNYGTDQIKKVRDVYADFQSLYNRSTHICLYRYF